tara:strand:+ start:124 stop:717 length:594 start_codon:yes stop_codon:yes gene_type:complete
MSKIIKQINFFLESFKKSIDALEISKLENLADELIKLRVNNGRLFFLGVGGSAGNCSHAVNDFRKLCKINALTPTDNISEITARINDDGWENSYRDWLTDSKLCEKDALFIFSVGGGDIDKNVSVNLIKSIELAKKKNSKIFSIVGRENSYTFLNSDIALHISSPKNLITPISETMQTLLWHILVSLEELIKTKTKW